MRVGPAHRDQLSVAGARLSTRPRRAVRREVADLTVLATEKVTRKSLDEADQKRLVEDALSEVDFSALSGAEAGGESK